MKFKNDIAWVLAMDALQGDIPDPSSFRPAECKEPEVPAKGGAARGDAPAAAMRAASGAATNVTPLRGASRAGHGGRGSMSC